MTYPYIGKGIESGSIVLIYGKDSAIVMDSKTWAAKDSEDTEVDESYFKNITAEYLANTYGEIKSKEHAGFIVKLCGGDGSSIGNSWSQSLKCFVIDSDGKVSFGSRVYYQEKVGKREITIPLPPECESVPFKNINTDNIEIMKFDIPDKKEESTFSPTEITFNVPEGLDLSFDTVEQGVLGSNERHLIINVTDNRVYEYDDSSDDEWPRVGSEVTWGNCSHTAEVIAIHNNMAWVFTEGEYHNEIAVSKLQKPKTPEQELLDELHAHFEKYTFADQAINELPLKYNITKKGEGDE